MLYKELPGPRNAARAIARTMLNPGGLWQTTGGGDALYALDERGVYRAVENIRDVNHGVFVEWHGMQVAESLTVSWCECHADHPVVRAAVIRGRFLQHGTSEAELLLFAAWQAERARDLRRAELLREIAELDDAQEQAERELAEKLPGAVRRTAAHERARRRRGIASARRRTNARAHGVRITNRA